MSLILKTFLKSAYVPTSTSQTNIPGLAIVIPEDGYYIIGYALACTANDNGTAGAGIYTGMSIDGNPSLNLKASIVLSSTGTSVNESHTITLTASDIVYLKRTQVLYCTVAEASADDECEVQAQGTNFSSCMYACKI